jgi:hypothetical protein
MTDEIKNPPFIEDLSVREVYAEICQTLFGSPGILRIELGVNRWTQSPPIRIDRMMPVARFAIPLDTARALRDQLTRCLDLVGSQQELGQMPAASPAKN